MPKLLEVFIREHNAIVDFFFDGCAYTKSINWRPVALFSRLVSISGLLTQQANSAHLNQPANRTTALLTLSKGYQDEQLQYQQLFKSKILEDNIPATSMTTAGHTSDPNPRSTQNLVSTTPEVDGSQESGTRCTQELPSDDSLQEEFTPATALDFTLDLDYLTNLPVFNSDLDQIDWDDYYSSTVFDNALEAFQHANGLDGEDAEEETLEPGFDASAAQPESDPLPGFPYDHNGEVAATQIASTQEPNLIFQDTVDPGDLSVRAVKDLSDLFGIFNPSGRDLNGSFSVDFELPENTPGLDFLQSLHLMGSESKSAMSPDADYNTPELPHSTGNRAIQDGSSSADRVVLAGSSEPNLKAENRVVLTNPSRLSKGTQQRHYIPNTAYTPLDQAPKKWDIFEYTRDGELDPSRLFSVEEINRFLFNHPLHSGHHNFRGSQLKLRVHKTPAASAKRFPNGLRCRFKDCPMGTINQGQLLVMVDELSVQHPNHDLFLNAAYFHLWCMERYCNFEEICVKLDVSAKGRDARWEDRRKNRFCLGSEEERVVEDWVEACRAHGRRGFGGKPWVTHACPDQPNGCSHFDPSSLPYKGTLCHQLTVTKLHYGGQGRINLRRGREERAGYEGANITRHLGDLSREAELREFSRSHRNQNQLKLNPKTGRHYRADGDEIKEKEQSGSGYSRPETNRQQTYEPSAVGGAHQTRGTKRSRDERCDDQTLNHDIVQAHKKTRHHGPILKMPIWNDNQGQNFCPAGTPGISPRTTLTPKFQRTRSQLQTTATSPTQDGRSASITGLQLTTSEDESEGEIELAILVAQRRRRLLEIEDAKDNEKECKLRKLKLQEACKKKRAREEEDDDRCETDSRGKRQRI